MLTAIEDIDVVVPVHADTADFLKRPIRREFRPVLHWFVRIFVIAHCNHGQDPFFFTSQSLSRSGAVRPAIVPGEALAAKSVKLPNCGSSGWNGVSGIIKR